MINWEKWQKMTAVEHYKFGEKQKDINVPTKLLSEFRKEDLKGESFNEEIWGRNGTFRNYIRGVLGLEQSIDVYVILLKNKPGKVKNDNHYLNINEAIIYI